MAQVLRKTQVRGFLIPRTVILFFAATAFACGIFIYVPVKIPLSEKCSCAAQQWGWKQELVLEAVSQGPPLAKKFLTLGIATVYRKEEYLRRTIESLLNQSRVEEREWTTIVIFLADTDEELRNLQLALIVDNFGNHVHSGFIQIITATPSIYPAFDFVQRRRTYNDSAERVMWRTKQVIDFAFLFSYVRSHDLSDYHVVLEDDLLASNLYLTAIREFVSFKTTDKSIWSALQFTTFLGIGLLFKTSDLEKLVEFLLLFHQEHPVDGLMKTFTKMQSPLIKENGVVTRVPSVFQHIGKKSTLRNKVQEMVDLTFGDGDRKFENYTNPPAKRLSTTLKIIDDLVPDNAYSSAPGWFRGNSSQNATHDTFDIRYGTPIPVNRIVVISGLMQENKRIVNGTLYVGTSVPEGAPFCNNLKFAGSFQEGEIDVSINDTPQIQCIQIRIFPQVKPIIIREVKVF